MTSAIRKKIIISIILSCSFICGLAQNVDVRSIYDQFDRLEQVRSGDKIEIQVGESIGIYSDTDAIVERYDSAYKGAYLNAAYVFFSDGTTNSNDSKYIKISHTAPKDDINALYGLKPSPGYIDMKIHYVIAYYNSKGTVHLASGEYTFKVKVVGKNGGGETSLQELSLPKEITIHEWYDYLLTPTIKPLNANTMYTWESTNQSVAFTLAGNTAIELGDGKYFSENVSLYISEKDCCIRARNEGSAIVTVTSDEGLTASVIVNVIPFNIRKSNIMDVVYDIYDTVTESLKR